MTTGTYDSDSDSDEYSPRQRDTRDNGHDHAHSLEQGGLAPERGTHRGERSVRHQCSGDHNDNESNLDGHDGPTHRRLHDRRDKIPFAPDDESEYEPRDRSRENAGRVREEGTRRCAYTLSVLGSLDNDPELGHGRRAGARHSRPRFGYPFSVNEFNYSHHAGTRVRDYSDSDFELEPQATDRREQHRRPQLDLSDDEVELDREFGSYCLRRDIYDPPGGGSVRGGSSPPPPRQRRGAVCHGRPSGM